MEADNLPMRREQTRSGLIFLAVLSMAAWFCGGYCRAQDCTGPSALQSRIATHPDSGSYSELGAWFGERKNFRCAVDTLQAGLHLDPNSMRLNYLLGLTLFSSGQIEESLRPLERSTELDSKALEPHLILGTALAQLQRQGEARVQWKAALRIDPGSTVALDGLGKSLIAAGEYGAAVSLLRTAKRNEELTLDLALAYDRGGMLERSSETLVAALRTSPSSVRLTDALARVYVQQRRSDTAAKLLKESLAAHPNDVEGQRIYLPILVLSGEFSAAQPIAVKLLALDPHNFEVLFLNGVIEHQYGHYDAAREHLKQAIAMAPDDSYSHYYMGLTLIGLDDSVGARAELEKAVTLDPANAEAHFQLANILRSSGDKDSAQEQSKIAQQLFVMRSQHFVAQPKATEAAKKLAAGDIQGAIALYREAVEAAPQDASIAYKLALAFDKAGDTEAERTTLEQTLHIDPTMAVAQNQLGYVLSRGGDVPDAEKHFHLAVQSAPAYTAAWVNYAAALAVESRLEEAEKALSTALQLEPGNAQALGLKKDLDAAHATKPAGQSK
jgi:Flp pilus assembly protein TadD